MAAALILLSSLVLMPIGSASAATVYYSFIGVVDEAKKDASDYGFSVGDIIRGTASIDDAQVPYSSETDKAVYKDGGIFIRFSVESSTGTLLYSSDQAADDIKMTLENDNGGSDKWELEDSSARAAITSINGSKTSAFNVLKIKVEDDANNDTFNSVVPFADSTITIANWNKKKEFQLKFETGGEEV